MHQQSNTIIIIAALILFSIYRRVRRNIGWQKLQQKNLWYRTALFFIVGLGFLIVGIFQPVSLLSDIGGILAGAILAYYSANMTNFEHREGSLYYRPNVWIGSIVTVLFFARLLFRFDGIYNQEKLGSLQAGTHAGLQNMGFAVGNSWTTGLMLIMFAYYVIYNSILLRKQKELLSKAPETEIKA